LKEFQAPCGPFLLAMKPVIIRPGEKKDLPSVLELIRELARYERAEHEVTNTLEQMERDGFGEQPVYDFFVSEAGSDIIGISIFYFRYSTWKGKRLYLEDIVVTETQRGRGIGKMLFEHTMRKSLTENCSGMMWQVLEWNEPAINFYKKYGAGLDGEWTNCSLEAVQIMKLLNDSSIT
jgi:GNAT superfamily N-acetyltransferase